MTVALEILQEGLRISLTPLLLTPPVFADALPLLLLTRLMGSLFVLASRQAPTVHWARDRAAAEPVRYGSQPPKLI